MPNKLGTLENLIGHKFQEPQVLQRAITHRSWAYENLPDESEEKIRDAENESMEFVGDSVLGLTIAEELFRKHPKLNEGGLTLMKHHLVSTQTLAKVARQIGLGDFIRVGRGEEKTGGRKKQALLADTLEAVIAAVFLDSGYVAARAFIIRIFTNELKNTTPALSLDHKTLLQETLQAEKLPAPVYKLVKTEGMPHDRTFYVEAIWPNGKAGGSGNSIKAAEMKAASEAMKKLGRSRSVAAKRKA